MFLCIVMALAGSLSAGYCRAADSSKTVSDMLNKLAKGDKDKNELDTKLKSIALRYPQYFFPSLKDKTPEVRILACQYLGRANKREAVPHLAELFNDQTANVVTAAGDALIAIEHNDVRDKMVRLLKSKDAASRRGAARVLMFRYTTKMRPDLEEALSDEDRIVKMHVCQALGKLADPKSIPVLINVLKDEDNMVRANAISALASIGQMSVQPLLDAAAKEDDWKKRGYYCEALIRIGRPAALKLIDALGSRNVNLSRVAAEALAKIQGPEVEEILIRSLSSRNSELRRAAAAVLQERPSVNAGKALIRLFSDSSIAVRNAAVSALAALGKQSIELVLPKLESNDKKVLEAVMAVLMKINKESIPTLIKLLTHDKVIVRDYAANILAKTGAPALKDIAALLGDKEKAIRLLAIAIMGRFTDGSSIATLIELLGDKEYVIQEAARNALKNISGKDFGLDKEKWDEWNKSRTAK